MKIAFTAASTASMTVAINNTWSSVRPRGAKPTSSKLGLADPADVAGLGDGQNGVGQQHGDDPADGDDDTEGAQHATGPTVRLLQLERYLGTLGWAYRPTRSTSRGAIAPVPGRPGAAHRTSPFCAPPVNPSEVPAHAHIGGYFACSGSADPGARRAWKPTDSPPVEAADRCEVRPNVPHGA